MIGNDVEDEAHAASLHLPDEVIKVLLASQLGIHHHGIDHIVPMLASRRGFADGRQVAIGDAESVEIGHGPHGVGKGKGAVQLQPVCGQWKRRLWRSGHDTRLNSSAFADEGCGRTTRPEWDR